jgi:hypothetical protein
MSRFVRVCLAIALAGCETGGAGNALGLCSTVCRCLEQLPSQQRACVDECLAQGVVDEAPAACEACVFEHASSCEDLLTRCEDPCSPQPVPDDPTPPPPPEPPTF